MMNISGKNAVGGLVGRNVNSAQIINSYATGNVTGSYTGPSTADGIGGLVGNNLNSSTISKCYATGNVKGNTNVGGLVGEISTGSISNCYAKGTVTGIGSDQNFFGGFVGQNTGDITNCYSTGNVTGTGIDIQGFVGLYNSGTLTSCYYSGTPISGLGSSVTTAQMQNIGTFSGWDFNGIPPIWVINPSINNGYPYLYGMAP